jgi:hypothetical protein
MSYGVMTRNAEELDWPEFDVGFYEAKQVSGEAREPTDLGVNAVSAFADTALVAADPEMAPVAEDGTRATRESRYFDWSYVCPSRERYREGLLATVEDCVEASPDLRLDDVGFPRAEFCHCEVCDRAFADSEYEDRADWRVATVTEFVADVCERVPGDLYCTLYPDPYPGHLRDRSGVDPAALADYVDEFVVPLYDTAYATTHWLESLAAGFRDELDRPFSVELYAVNVDVDNLVTATEVAESYADRVVFGYQSANARGALRRMRAEAGDGDTHHPEDV